MSTHQEEKQIEFDVIKTPEDGQKWMENISAKLSRYRNTEQENTYGQKTHFSQRLSSINDDIWFGVDTETTEKTTRGSPYNNSEIAMLQVYGNYTNPTKQQTETLMDKPVIFQLFDAASDKINIDLLESIKPFLIDPFYSKVFHNYSFDAHVINNALRCISDDEAHKLSGFAADSMHLARLLDAGIPEYSLKSLSETFNPDGHFKLDTFAETEFSLKTVKSSDENDISLKTNPSLWYPYAALDPISTFELCCKLKQLLLKQTCKLQLYDLNIECNGWDIYESIWRPFGELLTQMEANGFHIDLQYLQELQKESETQREMYINIFKQWAEKVTGDEHIRYINCQSKTQLGYLFFGDQYMDIQITTGVKYRKLDPALPKTFTLPTLGITPTTADRTGTGRFKFTGKILDELIEAPHGLRAHFSPSHEAIECVDALRQAISIGTQINTFILPLQKYADKDDRLHAELSLGTETGRLSCKSPNLQNQPANKDIFKVRKAFTTQCEDNTLIIADYAQLELRVLAFLAECQSMIDAFECGGDFHSRTAASMYSYIQKDIDRGDVLLDGDRDDIPLVKYKYKKERTHAKMVNFSIAYGKTAEGLASDLDVTFREAQDILDKWYSERCEVKRWQQRQMLSTIESGYSYSLIGRYRKLFDPLMDLCCGDERLHNEFVKYIRKSFNINGNDDMDVERPNKNTKMNVLWQQFVKEYKKQNVKYKVKSNAVSLNKYMRQAINSPVQSSAADIVVKSMLNIWENDKLRKLGYRLLLQIHDEVILEGPKRNVEEAKDIVRRCMENPWNGMKQSVLFKADVKDSDNWYDGK